MIKTATLRFWGFEEHPFSDNILRDQALSLFVNRDDELAQVEDALGRSRVVGVYGNLGIGKSSLLHKLREELARDSIPVAYVHLNADSESTLYRELLAELLVLIENGSVSLQGTHGLSAEEEAQRLHASVSSSRGADFGAKLAGIGGSFVEDRTVSVEMHTESSARESIRQIFDALEESLVVIFDDFEKLQYEASGKTRDYFPILSRFVSTLEELLNRKYVSFVVSMDDQVEAMMERHRKGGGQFAFSMNSLCPVRNLTLWSLWDLISVRLESFGWKGNPADFISDDGFFALAVASANHPRRAVTILAEAMLFVARSKDRATRTLDSEAIQQGSVQARYPLDEKDLLTIQYLLEHGESSYDDDRLRQELGYRRSKAGGGYHTSVSRRLNALAEALRLEFDEVPTATGQTVRKVLRLPKVDRA